MASPITNALATRWIRDGTALAMLDAVREESMARQALAARQPGAARGARAARGISPVGCRWPRAGAWSEFASFPAHPGRRRGRERGVLDRR